MAVELARKLWTVEEYEQMIEKGILDEDDRVELIRGEKGRRTKVVLRKSLIYYRVR